MTFSETKRRLESGRRKLTPMDEYRVRYWNEDGREDYMGFGTMEQAQVFYDSLDGMAEIQKYDEEQHAYEAVVFPKFEF